MSLQLNNKETCLIKKFAFLSRTVTCSLISSLLCPFIWMLAVMTDELCFGADGVYYPGFYAMLILTTVLLIYFCYASLRLTYGSKSPEWENILSVAAGNLESGEGIFLDSDNKIKNRLILKHKVYLVGKAAGVKLKKHKLSVASIFFVPLLIITLVFIPRFISSSKILKEQKASLEITSKAISKSFKSDKFDLSLPEFNSPSDFSHFASCRYKGNRAFYVFLRINEDGFINDIGYHTPVDFSKSTDENLKIMNDFIKECDMLLSSFNERIQIEGFKGLSSVPQSLTNEFLKSDLKEETFKSSEGRNPKLTFSSNIDNYRNEFKVYLYFTIS